MAYKEYKRYLTDHEYANLKAMRIAIGHIRRQLDENKIKLQMHEKKLEEKSEWECHLYHKEMRMMLGHERTVLKNTRKKIEILIDGIVKKAYRRAENLKFYEEQYNNENK